MYIRASRRKKKQQIRTNGWTGFYEGEHPVSRRVVQMNLNGHYLNDFQTMSIAAFKTKINITSISKCCNGQGGRKKAGGFKWCFAEDFEDPEKKFDEMLKTDIDNFLNDMSTFEKKKKKLKNCMNVI